MKINDQNGKTQLRLACRVFIQLVIPDSQGYRIYIKAICAQHSRKLKTFWFGSVCLVSLKKGIMFLRQGYDVNSV